MALTPPGWRSSPWADPRWWAEQQLTVLTATTTYLTRVAQACVGVRVLDAPAPALAPAQAQATSAEELPGAPAEELPVPRWDEQSLGSIRARLARLSEADLAQLRQYEERHGARPDVLSMLANRLIKIRQAG
jgi:hypothetical protein